jgi:hypothetical protein
VKRGGAVLRVAVRLAELCAKLGKKFALTL